MELHLEDHSGGMDRSTGACVSSVRDQPEGRSSEPFPFADDMLCWICRISSSANVAPTCGRCGDSAWHLSCVYGGQWKRAFRVNTRVVHFAVLHRAVRSARRSVYNCFTLAVRELFIGIFCSVLMVFVFHSSPGLHCGSVPCVVIAVSWLWLVDFHSYSSYYAQLFCSISLVKSLPGTCGKFVLQLYDLFQSVFIRK